MIEVSRVKDKKLGRDVAIMFLPGQGFLSIISDLCSYSLKKDFWE
jgi:hypothetical protein